MPSNFEFYPQFRNYVRGGWWRDGVGEGDAFGISDADKDLSRVHIRPRLWSNYNRIKYEMGSHQLITVHDYNWIIITSNNLKGVAIVRSRDYSA